MICLLIVMALVSRTAGDYTCLCSYEVETHIYARPQNGSGVIGSMYEFDCLSSVTVAVLSKSYYAIAYNHKVGYVVSSPQLQELLCQGHPPLKDIIYSTTTTTERQTPTGTTTTSTTTEKTPSINATTITTAATTIQNTVNTTTPTLSTMRTTHTPSTSSITSTSASTTMQPSHITTNPTQSTTKSFTKSPQSTTIPITKTTTLSTPLTKTTTQSTTKATPLNTTATTQTTTIPTTTTHVTTHTPVVTHPVSVHGNTNLCPPSLHTRDIKPENIFQRGIYCYEFVPYLSDWFIAEYNCPTKGGEMVYITDQTDQDFVLSMLNVVHYYHPVWLGLHDVTTEEHWEWVSDAPLTYSNWMPSRFNSRHHHNEDCALFVYERRGQWDDVLCKGELFEVPARYPWICQYNITMTQISGPGPVG